MGCAPVAREKVNDRKANKRKMKILLQKVMKKRLNRLI